MKFHTQQFRHDPDNGIYGDCQRAVIASLLDLELSDVPHFGEDNPDAMEFHDRIDAFLNARGLARFTIAMQGDLEQILLSMSVNNERTVYTLAGRSPRGTNHCVVCRGGKIICDPHPDGGAIVAPCSDGYFWVEAITHAHKEEAAC